MSLEDMAYEDSRDSFEEYREKIVNRAIDAHNEGYEETAQALLREAKDLVYTGLRWQEDNGLMDDLYPPYLRP